MDAIREQLKKPVVLGIAALVLGLIIGLFFAWVVWPVQYYDAAVSDLRRDLQVEWMRMAIDSYAQNADALLAQQRYQAVGEAAPEVLAEVQQNPGSVRPETIPPFAAAVGAPVAQITPLPGTPAPQGTQPLPGAGPVEEEDGGFNWLLIVLLCLILLVAAGAVAYFFLRGQGGVRTTRTASPAMQAQQARQQAEWTDYSATGETPMVQFMASYKLGDDLFDDSFSIDSPSGEFLGECGVGISETIGVGDPKKVTAFEVWLFDKNDIQTVTKVLMSAHAFLDEAVRQRLATKGEPILLEAGTQTELTTQSLRLAVRVVDMGYGEGALPAHSFFDRLILELAVFPKSA
jgi:hypothetical protein